MGIRLVSVTLNSLIFKNVDVLWGRIDQAHVIDKVTLVLNIIVDDCPCIISLITSVDVLASVRAKSAHSLFGTRCG